MGGLRSLCCKKHGASLECPTAFSEFVSNDFLVSRQVVFSVREYLTFKFEKRSEFVCCKNSESLSVIAVYVRRIEHAGICISVG